MMTPKTNKRKLPQATGKAIKRLLGVKTSIPRLLKATHELKNIDVQYHASPSGPLSLATLLSGIIQGSSGINRTGREIYIEHVEVHFDIYLVPNVLANSDAYRIDVIRDAHSKGAAPGATDITTNNTYVGYLYNNDNVKRFRHLYDSKVRVLNCHTTGVGVGVGTFNNRVAFNKKIRVGAKTRYYNTSNAGTIADCETGAIYLVLSTENSQTTFDGQVRVWFRDV